MDSAEMLPMVSNKKSLLIKTTGGLVLMGGVGFALPLITNVFLGGMAISAIAVTAVVAAITCRFIPLIFQKIDNIVLGLEKDEVRKRPIEQLQNSYLKGCELAEKEKKKLTEFQTKINNLQTFLEKNLKDFPDQDWSATENDLREAKEDYKDNEAAVAELILSTEMSKKQIDFWERRLETAKITEEMHEVGGKTRNDILQEFLKDVATAEVASRLNKACAVVSVDRGLKKRRKELTEAAGAKRISNSAM